MTALTLTIAGLFGFAGVLVSATGAPDLGVLLVGACACFSVMAGTFYSENRRNSAPER